jgi:hypothetical protein
MIHQKIQEIKIHNERVIKHFEGERLTESELLDELISIRYATLEAESEAERMQLEIDQVWPKHEALKKIYELQNEKASIMYKNENFIMYNNALLSRVAKKNETKYLELLEEVSKLRAQVEVIKQNQTKQF